MPSNHFSRMAEASSTRFANITEDDIATLLSNKDSQNTKRATKVAVGVFQLYLQEKGQSTDFASFPMPVLNDLLNVEARRKDK